MFLRLNGSIISLCHMRLEQLGVLNASQILDNGQHEIETIT